jgi:hypothetical protein
MLTSQYNFHFTIEEFPQFFSMNELGQLTPVTCGVNQRKTSLLQYDIEVCILAIPTRLFGEIVYTSAHMYTMH